MRQRRQAWSGLAGIAAIALGLTLTGCEASGTAPLFHPQSNGVDQTFNGIVINDAFLLGAPFGGTIPAGRSAGLFLSIYNQGGADRLVGATSRDAKAVLLPKGGISLPRGQAVYLTGPAPAIVLRGLTRQLPPAHTKPPGSGTTVSVTLDFAVAGSVTLNVPIIPRSDQYATFSPAPSASPSPASTRHASKSPAPTTGPATSPG